MTPLKALLHTRIAQEGPISLADYMATCLGHPKHGYYRKQDPLGAAGDFTTAPEISQMFGELLGVWLAQVWMDQGNPAGALVELGPGRGTLMADILRATRRVPGMHAALDVVLVETSPALRARQADALADYRPIWANDISELPDGPLFVMANEFFDALPIQQFQRSAGGWQERMVGLSDETLSLGLAPPTALPVFDAQYPMVEPGTVIEHCPSAEGMIRALGAQIGDAGGAILAIDYGDWEGTGDTFQALSGHAPVDPFEAPGDADLTAHVNFRAIARASGLRPFFNTQGALLQALGIGHRAEALAQIGDPDAIAGQLQRLTGADEMGTLFKALALMPASQRQPPGFEEERSA